MTNKILIIGGGIIGLSLGWQLVKKGMKVELLEKNKSGKDAGQFGQASWVSAGLLAPQAELGFEEIELFNLCRKSLELYPMFLAELSKDSGVYIEVERTGTLFAGFDRDDAEFFKRLFDFRKEVGLPVQWLTGSEAREIEPLLSPKCSCGVWIPEDAQVNNRVMIEALKIAFEKCGGQLYEEHIVEKINIENGKVVGAHFHDIDVEYDVVIVAAGSWSKQIEGIPDNILPPVRPVKGQTINLKMNDECMLTHSIRGYGNTYLVPKSDGRLTIGGTVEEMGFDNKPTAGAIKQLLEDAWEIIPSIYDLEIESIDVGLRPGSRDNYPIIGDSEIEGLFFATGHFRNGILLTPVTAYELSDWIVNGNKSETLNDFQLSRFHKEVVQ